MVCIKTYQKALAPLTPLLSRLSSGTEMASYGDAQWNFLLGGGDVTAFLASEDHNGDDNLLGCLLRINLDGAKGRAAGFGMMLVDTKARGKGVAKSLLNEAIFADDASSEDIRKLLAVCTEKGQPVYRKLGFSDVGMVSSLTTDIRTAKAIPRDNKYGILVKTYGSLNKSAENNKKAKIDPDIQKLLINMDQKATGFDRTERLSFLLKNDCATSVKSVAAIASMDDKENVVASAILRQEQPGGPFAIGPIIGEEDAVLPMIRALVASIPEEDSDLKVSILVSGRIDLIDRLKKAGFTKGFEFPAMALDSESIYKNGDGSYISLIHPTLG